MFPNLLPIAKKWCFSASWTSITTNKRNIPSECSVSCSCLNRSSRKQASYLRTSFMMSAVTVKYFCCWLEREWRVEVLEILKSRNEPFIPHPSLFTCVTQRGSHWTLWLVQTEMLSEGKTHSRFWRLSAEKGMQNILLIFILIICWNDNVLDTLG